MKRNLKILQLIDSLETGGAERMAVNYANALAEKIEFSAIISTRKSGPLEKQISDSVTYLNLNKTRTIDFKAILKLRKFIAKHQINFIHAHSSSYFLAVLVKLTYPTIKIIWHDHNGNRVKAKSNYILKLFSLFFFRIISVNNELKNWAEINLFCKKNNYLPNFVSFHKTDTTEKTELQGEINKRIVYLANLRHPKNHIFLVELAKKIKESGIDWTFHFIGNDYNDQYSCYIKDKIKEYKLEKTVYIYGSKNDISNILNQSEIATLVSSYEGLPVSILEYGYFNKPVIATNVGQIPDVIENNVDGLLSDSNDINKFTENLILLINNKDLRDKLANNFNKKINNNYTQRAVINQYLKIITST